MKKLISILVLGVMFISCVRVIEQEDFVIEVNEFTEGRFEVRTVNYSFSTDSLYRVGDTLKIGKKQ